MQKDVYENFLEAGEGILDLNKEHSMTELKHDIDDVIVRWDTMCSNIEKCLNRLRLAKVPNDSFFSFMSNSAPPAVFFCI